MPGLKLAYRPRRWDTRVGTIELGIPKLREGSYFPSLLEPRRRSDRALVSVVTQAYVEGVSTRRVDDLTAWVLFRLSTFSDFVRLTVQRKCPLAFARCS